MPLPKPKKNESEKDFIGRCVSILANEGDRWPNNDQRVAVCYSQWKDIHESIVAGDVAKNDTNALLIKRKEEEKKKKKKNKLLESYISEINKVEKIYEQKKSADNIIELFGGKSYFKKFFNNYQDALNYIYEQLKTFNISKNDINEKNLIEKLKKIIG